MSCLILIMDTDYNSVECGLVFHREVTRCPVMDTDYNSVGERVWTCSSQGGHEVFCFRFANHIILAFTKTGRY